jgi:hypothetical protein
MSTDDALTKKVVTLESIRMDKTVFSVISVHDADADLKAHWKAQTPQARLEALELMRQVAYGYNPLTAQLERVLAVAVTNRELANTPGQTL